MEPNTVYEGVHFTAAEVIPRLVKQHYAWSIIRTYTDIDGIAYELFLDKRILSALIPYQIYGYQQLSFVTRSEARGFLRLYKTNTQITGKLKVVKVLIAMADIS